MKRTSVVIIIVLALGIISIVAYLARPRAEETAVPSSHEVTAPTTPSMPAGYESSALANCVGTPNSSVPLASLTGRHQAAHSLVLKNQLASAIPQLRSIAAVDPGYPAIYLEISDALLEEKHASEARDAIKLQLDISECLANLPPRDLQAYCKAEGIAAAGGGCDSALTKISQQAHYQSGLVDAELRRGPAPAVAKAEPRPMRVAPAPAVPAAPPAAQTAVVATPPADPAPAPKPLPPPIIKSLEAADHVGQRATVCGSVVSKHTAEESNGKPTFINLDRTFPNQTFTVLIWGADSTAVGDFPESGGVCVTGTIATYRGTPQVVVRDAKSWYRSSQQ